MPALPVACCMHTQDISHGAADARTYHISVSELLTQNSAFDAHTKEWTRALQPRTAHSIAAPGLPHDSQRCANQRNAAHKQCTERCQPIRVMSSEAYEGSHARARTRTTSRNLRLASSLGTLKTRNLFSPCPPSAITTRSELTSVHAACA